MRRRVNLSRRVLAFVALGLVAAGPSAYGAGFSIFEQGTKAMGMAGAFTAQADDGSAMFHNAGGLAFQKDFAVLGGFTYIRSLSAEFEGADPFPGAGYTAEQETLSEFPPHAYWVQPVGHNVTFGLGLTTPFGLTTEWEDDFRGRFISRLGSLTALDVNPTIAWQVGNFGFGIGAVGRFSTVELERHVAAINPFTFTAADVATLHLEGDFDNDGYGWNAGLLHKYNNSFSWGFSYRSKIEVDYQGDARLSQNLTGTPFDALVAASLPFGRDFPVETEIEFPDSASFGVAVALGPASLVELDVNWTGWSSFDRLPIDFPGGELPSQVLTEEYDDTNHYRLGFRWDSRPGRQWRFGVVWDETPQPEGAVNPLLPDADRLGFTLGYGYEGAKWSYDFAVMYLDFDERTRDENFPGEDDDTFFGSYQNQALLVGLTLGYGG